MKHKDRKGLSPGIPRVFLFEVLLLVILMVCACGSSDERTCCASDVTTRTIDFDSFVNGIPEDMTVIEVATTGDTEVRNSIDQDSVVVYSGFSSMRITGSEETTSWQKVSVDIPGDTRCVTARFFARGQDLGCEAEQYNNCHAGFWFENIIGNVDNELVWFPTGTSDWEEFTVSLDVEGVMADSVTFAVFSSVSGILWIDELIITCSDEASAAEEKDIPEAFSEYINHLSSSTTFMDLAPEPESECPLTISSDEALEDLEMLRYLFENAYSGYEYWENQGVDFSAIYHELAQLVLENENVSVFVMQRIIAEGLEGVQDGHLAITGHETHRFLSRMNPYFTDVIVERDLLEDGAVDSLGVYLVVRSSYDQVYPGMMFTGPEDHLFPIMSRTGVEQFQLGVFSTGYESEAAFQFQNHSEVITSIELPLHQCRLSRNPTPDDDIFFRTEVDGIDLVRIASFGVDNNEVLLEFGQSGTDLAETDNLIVDLMGNSGGSSRYARSFVEGLNRVADWRMYYAVLCSPATIGSYAAIPVTDNMPEGVAATITRMQISLDRLQERPVRCWIHMNSEIPPRQMGDYKGRAVFLVDRHVASSGEALLDYSKSIPGAVLVGENSAGVGTFGEVRHYWLPNSKISVLLPSKLFLAPGFEEGAGYIPDYWLDSPDPVTEVTEWLNNPDSYQFELPPPNILRDLSFELFDNGKPLNMNVRLGATSGREQQYSGISRDTDIKSEGSSSLRLDGDIETDLWQSLYVDIPYGIETLRVTYDVRGENIHCESNQFDNCYVGFIYMDSLCNKQFEINRYEESFAWREDSLELSIEESGASAVQFCIFLSKSGSMWIDDVEFSAI